MDADVDVDDILQSPTSQFGRTLVLYSVSLLCKLALNVLNTTTAQMPNERTVQELLLGREEGTPLITVANHTRCALVVRGTVSPLTLLKFARFAFTG